MKINKILIFSVLVLLITCCTSKQKIEDISNKKDAFKLLGKKVVSIDSILDTDKSKTVFLFNYYDCSSCVDSGFVIVKKIDSINRMQKVYIVSTMGDPLYYQKRNNYYNYIYVDSKDLIRKELKYIQTPIIILLDSVNYIQDYILPHASDEKEIASFIKLTFSSP